MCTFLRRIQTITVISVCHRVQSEVLTMCRLPPPHGRQPNYTTMERLPHDACRKQLPTDTTRYCHLCLQGASFTAVNTERRPGLDRAMV